MLTIRTPEGRNPAPSTDFNTYRVLKVLNGAVGISAADRSEHTPLAGPHSSAVSVAIDLAATSVPTKAVPENETALACGKLGPPTSRFSSGLAF